MGVGVGLGLPAPLIAGAVLSGAYFGDKMSPLSDTTNTASAKDRGLAPENLSRVPEDAGTVVDPLVPWGSGGSYQTATLGVPTILYAPFAVFCWVSPLVTILFGYMGWTIKPLEREAPAVAVPLVPTDSIGNK